MATKPGTTKLNQAFYELRTLAGITFCLLACALVSQTSRLTINLGKSKKFYERVKNSALLIPVSDRDSEEGKALIAAVRKYWTHTPFKFISQEEFNEIRDKKQKNPHRIYLIRETYERLKYSRKDWAYTKYFLTTEWGGVEVLDAPFVEFKLPVKSENRQVKNPDYSFIYGLMIKQLNYDLELMNETNNYSQIKRETLIKASFKKELQGYKEKELLVSQTDLDNYVMNLPDSKKSEAQKERFIKYVAKKTKLDATHIKFVNEQEIKNAVAFNDSKKMVYTGFTLYNAEDGKMLRRIDAHSKNRKVNGVITVFLAVVIIAIGLFFFVL